MENDTIKDAWIKLIQAEDYLLKDITAFLPRMQQEETNPTFEHPKDWDHLRFHEKANLIIANKAVKLMERQYRGSVIGHQEGRKITNYRSSFLDKKPNILGGERNKDVQLLQMQAIITGLDMTNRNYSVNFHQALKTRNLVI